MRKIYSVLFILLLLSAYIKAQKAPEINVYPPQIHQQICQESTFTRYLDIFNTGDTTLVYNAAFSPETPGWTVLSGPLNGEILPGDTNRIEFDFNSAGLPLANYTCDFVIHSNDPKDTALVVLTMLHVQVLTILINPEQDSICLGCSTQLTTHVFGCSEVYGFSWISDPPGFSSTEKSPLVSPQVTTTYTVTVTDGNYSGQESVTIKVTPSSGINESSLVTDVSAYPNPSHESCVLKFFSEYKGEGFIQITDPSGSLLQNLPISLNKGMNEFKILTSDLAAGVYVISVLRDSGNNLSKLFSKRLMVF